jgi:hypothetical protein
LATWLLPVPGLPMISALAPSPMNFRVCNSKQALRGSLGLKRQSKSASVRRSARPERLKRRSIRRERRRSSSSCSMAAKVSRKGCWAAWACITRVDRVSAMPDRRNSRRARSISVMFMAGFQWMCKGGGGGVGEQIAVFVGAANERVLLGER